jgi:hypothetical protein
MYMYIWTWNMLNQSPLRLKHLHCTGTLISRKFLLSLIFGVKFRSTKCMPPLWNCDVCRDKRCNHWPNIISVTIIILLSLLLLLLLTSCCSLVTGFLSSLVLLPLSQWWTPPLRLQVSACSTFLTICDVPSMAVFVENLLSVVLVLFPDIPDYLLTIPVAPVFTEHFMFHIRWIYILRFLFSFLLSFLLYYIPIYINQDAGSVLPVFNHLSGLFVRTSLSVCNHYYYYYIIIIQFGLSSSYVTWFQSYLLNISSFVRF